MSKLQKPKHSLRKKLMLLYIPLLLVPLVLFAAISSLLFRQAIEKRSLASMSDQARVLAAQADAVIEAANNCATYLSLDIDQIYTDSIQYAGTQSRLRYEALIGNALSYARLIFPKIHSIAFIDTRGKVYTTHPQMVTTDPSGEATDYMNRLFASGGNRVWFKTTQRTWLSTDSALPLMTMGKKVWHTQTGKTIGYLFFNLSADQLTTGFDQDLATYRLVDGRKLLFDATGAADAKDTAVAVAEAMQTADTRLVDGTLMVKAPLKHLNLALIGYGDLSAHTPDLRQLTTLLVLAVAMTLTVLGLFTWFSQRFIVRPLKSLHQGVEAISEGDFSHQLPESNSDELGLLAAHINRMRVKIESLLAQEVVMAQRRRTLELDRLQAQIKPHFLYNTLDIITKLMEMGDLRRAKRASSKLASFYQRSLADGSEILTLAQEIQLIEDYMAIQNIRYGDAFQLTTDLPEALRLLPIPKLTLQPLVENAIYHGLKLVDRPGRIHILGTITPTGGYTIAIADNGKGLPPEQLEALNHQLASGQVPTEGPALAGFGLLSVAERLRLHYGLEAQLQLEAAVDAAGLLVILRIPPQ